MTAARRILVGIAGAPHGVKGELRFKPLTDEPLAVKTYGPLETEDGRRRFAVLAARLQGDMVVLKLDGVADRDAAAALTHAKLYVPRERLPAPLGGEFYVSDLIGLSVEDESGALIGEVLSIQNYGAGDLIEIGRERQDSALVPFTEAFVPKVDIPAGRIIIAPPDGLLDDEAENHDEEPG